MTINVACARHTGQQRQTASEIGDTVVHQPIVNPINPGGLINRGHSYNQNGIANHAQHYLVNKRSVDHHKHDDSSEEVSKHLDSSEEVYIPTHIVQPVHPGGQRYENQQGGLANLGPQHSVTRRSVDRHKHNDSSEEVSKHLVTSVEVYIPTRIVQPVHPGGQRHENQQGGLANLGPQHTVTRRSTDHHNS